MWISGGACKKHFRNSRRVGGKPIMCGISTNPERRVSRRRSVVLDALGDQTGWWSRSVHSSWWHADHRGCFNFYHFTPLFKESSVAAYMQSQARPHPMVLTALYSLAPSCLPCVISPHTHWGAKILGLASFPWSFYSPLPPVLHLLLYHTLLKTDHRADVVDFGYWGSVTLWESAVPAVRRP